MASSKVFDSAWPFTAGPRLNGAPWISTRDFRLVASRRNRRVVLSTALGGLFFLTLLVLGQVPNLLSQQSEQQPLPWYSPPVLPSGDDWSRFAYVQYVTNQDYLCNSVMFFEALHRLGSKPDRLMMYPSHMLNNKDSAEARLLRKAQQVYDVKLMPIELKIKAQADGDCGFSKSVPNTRHAPLSPCYTPCANALALVVTWTDSFTKLLAFNQTQYDRVLSIDSDTLLLHHMDELFIIPSSPVAMPRAYWLLPDLDVLTSLLLLVEPSEKEFVRVIEAVDNAKEGQYDMEIVNTLYGNSAIVLPHRPYAMLTAEFRRTDHSVYLSSAGESWDPVAAYNEAKVFHFSDWPLPKPWFPAPEDIRLEMEPKCDDEGPDPCVSRDIWNSFYSDFREQREV